MRRCEEPELLDGDGEDARTVARAYREIDRVHRLLGTTGTVLSLLAEERTARDSPNGSQPIRVLDIGCGHGAMLQRIRARLGLDVVGFDLRPAPQGTVPIFTGDATCDELPSADVAICVMMAHHLSPDDLARMIGNVSRTCRRFVIVDLVRHPLPLALFTAFLCPFLSRVNALDGQTSIRRAFTVPEMGRLVQNATERGEARVQSIQHTVAPLWMRQMVDIRWERTCNKSSSMRPSPDAAADITSASGNCAS